MESLNKIAEKVAELHCRVSALCIWWFGWFWGGRGVCIEDKQSKCKKYHFFIYSVAVNLNTEVERKKKSFLDTTWVALTEHMPLAYPGAVKRCALGSHIINTNKTLYSCSPFTGAQP